MQRSVQGLGGGEVAAEWLFDDDARAVMTVRPGQPFGHGREELRRNREVIQRATRSAAARFATAGTSRDRGSRR